MTKRDLIFHAMWTTSKCWNIKTGLFDTKKLFAICDKLIEDLDRYDEEAHAEYMANLALEVGDI